MEDPRDLLIKAPSETWQSTFLGAIPPEIFLLIVSHLDQKTQKNLALTCKNANGFFNQPILQHLFQAIVDGNINKAEAIVQRHPHVFLEPSRTPIIEQHSLVSQSPHKNRNFFQGITPFKLLLALKDPQYKKLVSSLPREMRRAVAKQAIEFETFGVSYTIGNQCYTDRGYDISVISAKFKDCSENEGKIVAGSKLGVNWVSICGAALRDAPYWLGQIICCSTKPFGQHFEKLADCESYDVAKFNWNFERGSTFMPRISSPVVTWLDACAEGGGMGVRFAVRWNGNKAWGQSAASVSRFEDGALLTAVTLQALNKVITTDIAAFMLQQHALLETDEDEEYSQSPII